MQEFILGPAESLAEALLATFPIGELPGVLREVAPKVLQEKLEELASFLAAEHISVVQSVVRLCGQQDVDGRAGQEVLQQFIALARVKKTVTRELLYADTPDLLFYEQDMTEVEQNISCSRRYVADGLLFAAEETAAKWSLVANCELDFNAARKRFQQLNKQREPIVFNRETRQLLDKVTQAHIALKTELVSAFSGFVYGIVNAVSYRRWHDEGCSNLGVRRHALDCLLELQADIQALAKKHQPEWVEK